MQFTPLDIPGLYLITPLRHSDPRGYFTESFRQDKFKAETRTDIDFVQDNLSYSAKKGTVRGLHFQTPPFGQGKLVSCPNGAVLDVAVDIRRGSPSFGQHYKTRLSSENGAQLWIPEGFLHGFVTLTDSCTVTYKVTNYYSTDCDKAVLWNDPDLAIDWEIAGLATLSDKDKAAPHFKDIKSPFLYEN